MTGEQTKALKFSKVVHPVNEQVNIPEVTSSAQVHPGYDIPTLYYILCGVILDNLCRA